MNLYIPSTVRWMQDGSQVSLTQSGEYPYEPLVQFEVKTSKAMAFAMNLRIPVWAEGASVAVNGKRQDAASGTFARVEREWRDGDRVELDLPLKPRLEAVDSQHPDTVALLVGPLVLFGSQVPGLKREHLLAAKKMARGVWHVSPNGNTVMKMVPWTVLGENQEYATYLKVT